MTSTSLNDSAERVIDLVGVSKTYVPSSRLLNLFVRSSITSPVYALCDVDLQLDRGQIKAIVGPNGAGKTTLFRIVVGLTTPSSGSAQVLGHDSVREGEIARRHIGFMPSDDRSLFMRLTCAENLRFHGRIHGLRGKKLDRSIVEALDAVGIGHRHDSAVFSLSAGMRARVQLARSIIHRPSLLVLDEPTATIDPVASHDLLGLLQALVAEYRMGALISSHRLEEIEALSTNVILLDRGRMRYDGDLTTLRAELDTAETELVFTTATAAAAAAQRVAAHAHVSEVSGRSFRLVPNRGTTVGEVLASVGDQLAHLERCHDEPMPLRDLLAEMYSDPDTAVPSRSGAKVS